VKKNKEKVANKLRAKAVAYGKAAEEAWDGEWYRRAYFDDGTPLGSKECDECKIDSIAQSWSILSAFGDKEHAFQALESVDKYLVAEDMGLIRLLYPPFDKGKQYPGYIKGYLPGVRENGAQYTHAALWTVFANARLGRGDRALQLFQMISPITHSRNKKIAEIYKVEPYVCAADIYTASPHEGRGGWSWYTGSGSWMYMTAVEGIIGFKKKGLKFTVDPCISKEWEEFEIVYRFESRVYTIKVVNPNHVQKGVVKVTLDGKEIDDKWISLEGSTEDKPNTQYDVVIELGEK